MTSRPTAVIFALAVLPILSILPPAVSSEPSGIDPDPRAPTGPKIFIGQNRSSIESYIRNVGETPDGFMFYTSVQRMEGLGEPVDSGAGIQDPDHFAARYPAQDLQIGLYMVGALDTIAQGRYNNKLNLLADWLARTPNHVYLRIGYEFDGPHNGYDPEPYILAYRRIVDHLRQRGVKNVSYVWHSYGGYASRDRMLWYPGEGYVDWVGLSYFDPGNLVNMENVAKMARSLGKPLMIAEATPRGHFLSKDPGAWDAWFARMFDFAARNDVRIISYINTDWEGARLFAGQGWGDSRIESSLEILAKWKARLAELKNGMEKD